MNENTEAQYDLILCTYFLKIKQNLYVVKLQLCIMRWKQYNCDYFCMIKL